MSVAQSTPLYERALGEDWARVHPNVRGAHLRGDSLLGAGNAKIDVANTTFALFVCRCLGVPAPGEHSVTIRVERKGEREIWSRMLGRKLLITKQRFLRDSAISEVFGFVEFDLDVEVLDGALSYRSTNSKLRLGPLSLPIPRALRPEVVAKESAKDDGTHVDVTVSFPSRTRLISYGVDLIWSPL